MNRLKVSKALLEVWKWKDECYREVAHLPRREALRTLMRNAKRVSREMNLGLKQATPSRPMMVAEARSEYSTASVKKRSKQK